AKMVFADAVEIARDLVPSDGLRLVVLRWTGERWALQLLPAALDFANGSPPAIARHQHVSALVGCDEAGALRPLKIRAGPGRVLTPGREGLGHVAHRIEG